MFRDEYIEQARRLCLLGCKDEELAKYFGVAVEAVDKWKQRYPAFLQAIKAGRQVADTQVAAALYKKACGYREGDTYYPPDTTAAIFWLKNRQREYWRDKQDVEHSGKFTVIFEDPFGRRFED